MAIELVSKAKCFNGYQKVYQHYSSEVGCLMKFSLYEPLDLDEPADVLFYLSGLGNTEQNFICDVGAQSYASEYRFIVVGPDTSPRGLNLPGEHDSKYIGEGAGAYLDATQGQWSKNYRMYSYVTNELPALIKENFRTSGRIGIFGHSMGGHGALVCGLRNPDLFLSISAFCPITSPFKCISNGGFPWSQYLGTSEENWAPYDSCLIAKAYNGPTREILIDQGLSDENIDTLMPENMRAAVNENPHPDLIKLELRLHEGYDHSAKFFAKTFIGDHFKHHARILRSIP